MTGSKNGNDVDSKSPRESGEDSEDESEILEESPCGRWSKRRQEVQQRDVPGIDAAYLAMDTDEGMEVVWNEVKFSERRNFREQEEKIRQVFDNLTQLDHPNIVKLHKYWTDTKNDKPRVVFITEYMSSGSLKKFLKTTRRNVKKLPLQSWKRRCTQILSALSYLHSSSPPIIHGNLTTDTIFIQHNGLVKIGSVAPDTIHSHVKTCRDDMKNMHFIAPEYGSQGPLTPAVDIYSFGMCALEMAALEIPGNGDSGNVITQEQVNKTIASLEHELQKDFIRKCLSQDAASRPTTSELLFHPVLFEVHSLKLLAAHSLIHNPKKSNKFIDNCIEELLQHQYAEDSVVAEIRHTGREPTLIRMVDIPVVEKLEKFVEDVRFGIYPLTAFRLQLQPPSRPRAISPEAPESVKSDTPEPTDLEMRKIVNMMCNVRSSEEGDGLAMTISLRMEDKMNRQLTCVVKDEEGADSLTEELVKYGLINQANKYYRMFITWTNQKIRRTFVQRNMFDFKHIKPFDKALMEQPGPMVVFATPGMLHAGLSLAIFKKWAPNENNMVIMPGYCVQGTVGHKILNGAKKVDFENRQSIDVRLTVEYMSFSAHADAKGIMQLIRHCEPRNVMLVHGENVKMDFLKHKIMQEFNINCYKPANGETAMIPVMSTLNVDVSLPLLKRTLSHAHMFGPVLSGKGQPGQEEQPSQKRPKILHGVVIMKNSGLKVTSIDEAWKELGVAAHQLRFTERLEVHDPSPVPALTSSIHSLLTQKLGWCEVHVVSEWQLCVADTVVISVQDDEPMKTVLLSWAHQDEALGSKLLEIIKAAFSK